MAASVSSIETTRPDDDFDDFQLPDLSVRRRLCFWCLSEIRACCFLT